MNHHSVIDTLSLSSTLSSSSNTGPGARCASNINPRIGGRMKFWLAPKLRTAHARQRRSGGPPPYRHNRQVESEASSGLPRMGGGYTSTLQLLRPAFFFFFPHGRMGRMGDVFRTFLDFRSATISVLNCVSAMGKAKRQTNGFLFFSFFFFAGFHRPINFGFGCSAGRLRQAAGPSSPASASSKPPMVCMEDPWDLTHRSAQRMSTSQAG
jgi:hypothetical protein